MFAIVINGVLFKRLFVVASYLNVVLLQRNSLLGSY
jgi:hypothetical protein